MFRERVRVGLDLSRGQSALHPAGDRHGRNGAGNQHERSHSKNRRPK